MKYTSWSWYALVAKANTIPFSRLKHFKGNNPEKVIKLGWNILQYKCCPSMVVCGEGQQSCKTGSCTLDTPGKQTNTALSISCGAMEKKASVYIALLYLLISLSVKVSVY